MPIYMKVTKNGVPIINGDATAKGHEKWIELTSFQYALPRNPSPQAPDRSSEKRPATADAVLTKLMDSASTQLAHLAAVGSVSGTITVQVDFVKTVPFNITAMTVTLQDVIITSFSMSGGRAGGQPSEQFTLNYTKIAFDVNTTDPASNRPLP